MDGPIAPISCVSVTKFSECGCPNPEVCALRVAFKDVRNVMSEVLDQTTFAELASRQRQNEDGLSKSFDFVI
jgi:DNA-binding IscR family transcriptional regulator